MKKRLLPLLLALLLCLAPALAARAAGDVPAAVLAACASVVRVEVEAMDGYVYTGSGFIVQNGAEGTVIVTNAHVVEDAVTASIWRTAEELQTAEVVAMDEQVDLAVLHVAEPLDAPALPLSLSAARGMAVYAIGYPGAADGLSVKEAHAREDATITDGLISAVRQVQAVSYGPEVPLLQTNAAINPGNSGGPLLNAAGHVIGVNTYRISDAQGVGGAIAAKQLVDTLSQFGYPIDPVSETAGGTPLLWIALAVALLAAGAVLAVLLVRRKKRAQAAQAASAAPAAAPRPILLAGRMLRLPENLSAGDIVSALMPVALELRDLHRDGRLFLRLSPYTVLVTPDGCTLSPDAEAPFTLADFTAPELLMGEPGDMRADVYAFSALLDALLRGADCAPDERLTAAISMGMARSAADRCPSMQELIFLLSPFNTGDARALCFVPSAGAQDDSPSQSRDLLPAAQADAPLPAPVGGRRRRRLVAICVPLGVLVIAGLAFGHVQANYYRAYTAMREMDFRTAQAAMDRTLVGGLLFPEDCRYIAAGLLMDDRRYDEAITAFSAMGSFECAGTCVLEANYRKAAMLADQRRYDDAVALYESLGDYRDSTDRALNTRFRKASYCLQNEDYRTAAALFDQLILSDRADDARKMRAQVYYYWAYDLLYGGHYMSAYDKAQEAVAYYDMSEFTDMLQPLLYQEMIDRYRTDCWSDVVSRCEALDGYEFSHWYCALAEIHTSGYASETVVREYLIPYIGYEDVDELLMLNFDTSWPFLLGEWVARNGEELVFSEDGLSWSVPASSYGDFWDLENGCLYFVSEKKQDRRPAYDIYVVSEDCIRVYAYKNLKTYTLYRVS